MTVKGEEPYFSRVVPESIPDDWTLTRLSVVCSFENGTNLPSDKREEGQIPVYGSNGVIDHHNESTTQAPVVVIGRKGSAGAVNYSGEEIFVVDTAYYVDCRGSEHSLRWLFYVLKSLQLEEQSEDSAIPGMNRELIGSHKVPLPSESQQNEIADFLDRRTARIDALVAKQKRLLDLLDEKRQAFITQEVTRGLDSTVPTKNTGTEWMDENPNSQWSSVPIKLLAQIRYGLSQPPEQSEDGTPIIRATNIDDGEINLDDILKIDPDDVPDSRNPVLSEDDIIVVRSGANTGESARIISSLEGAIGGYDMILSPENVDSEFLSWCLLSDFVREAQFNRVMNRAAQEHLNTDDVGHTRIPYPPERSQEDISKRLQSKTQSIRELASKIERSIDLLEEKRQALITAAVTGQIDVTEEREQPHATHT